MIDFWPVDVNDINFESYSLALKLLLIKSLQRVFKIFVLQICCVLNIGLIFLLLF